MSDSGQVCIETIQVQSQSNDKPLTCCKANLNDLFEQAYTFSSAHSWYKHIREPMVVNVFLKPTVDLAYTLEIQFNPSSKFGFPSMQTESYAISEYGATPSMLQFTKKYPVILTSDLGGHDGELNRRARYMFDRYLYFLKKHGVAEANAIDLPAYDKQKMAKLPFGESMSLRSVHYHHEKWRMIGELVHAACNLAHDEQIEVIDESPYPRSSPAWDYLKEDV